MTVMVRSSWKVYDRLTIIMGYGTMVKMGVK